MAKPLSRPTQVYTDPRARPSPQGASARPPRLCVCLRRWPLQGDVCATLTATAGPSPRRALPALSPASPFVPSAPSFPDWLVRACPCARPFGVGVRVFVGARVFQESRGHVVGLASLFFQASRGTKFRSYPRTSCLMKQAQKCIKLNLFFEKQSNRRSATPRSVCCRAIAPSRARCCSLPRIHGSPCIHDRTRARAHAPLEAGPGDLRMTCGADIHRAVWRQPLCC